MNLAHILEQSIDDLPRVQMRAGPPRPHPRLIVRQHQEREQKVFVACIPGGRPPHYFRFNEAQYAIVRLFNGERTVEEVVEAAASQLRLQLAVEDVKRFVEMLEDADFWYHTPQEQSVALCQSLMKKRHRRLKPESDLAAIVLCAFDPDNYLTWMNKHFSWIYSHWFTVWSFCMLLVAAVILGSHWREVWADSVDFWNFAGHGVSHFVNFMIAFFLLGAVHETAHGLTCKHFGGEVHRMGAHLVYLTPCIYCDVSHVWVHGDRWERMLTVFFGVWSEVVLCTYATVIWWAAPKGTFLHDFAYMIVLAGGIFCVLVNWNPFAKMDGYILCTEFFRIHDIKAVTTDWLISWIRTKVFHLPGSVQAVPLRRAIGYTAYALLSGVYCYSLLLFFVRIVYLIVHYYTPQWAFLPAGILTLKIFRSRIVKLGQFMKELYLDKKDLLQAHRKPIIVGAVALLIIGLLPLRRDKVTERFVLEPVQRAILRAQVPGRVVEIGAGEGQQVAVGEAIVTLRDLKLQSETALRAADLRAAESNVFHAQLRYTGYGSARQRLIEAGTAYRQSEAKSAKLAVVTPIAGTVITPRLKDLLGSYLAAGTEIAEVVDTSAVRARIIVPQPEMRKLRDLHDVELLMDSRWRPVNAAVVSISPASQPPDPGLIAKSEYRGIAVPEFFVVTVTVGNPKGEFRDGMTGTASIHGRRRSLIGLLFDPLLTAAARRLW